MLKLVGRLLLAFCVSAPVFSSTVPTPPRWVQPIEDAAPYLGGFGLPSRDFGPLWVRRADGSGLLLLRATWESWGAVHAFDSAGVQAGSVRLGTITTDSEATMRWVGAGTAAPWLLTEGSTARTLTKFAPDGSVRSRVDLVPRVTRHFLSLADNGLLTATPIETARLGADGQPVWMRSVALGAEYLHAISALPDGSSWAALTTTVNGQSKAQLRHLDADGVESARFDHSCPSCGSGYTYVLALPDGDVAVATQPNTVSRVSAAGSVLWTQVVGVPVRGLLPGPAGQLVVTSDDSRFRSLDLSTGALRWSHEARWLFPSTTGSIAVVHAPSYGLQLTVQRLDAEGQVLAEEQLDLAALGFDHFHAPSPAGTTGIELAAASRVPRPEADGCFANPVVLRVVPGAPLHSVARVCETPRPVTARALERSRGGVLLHTTFGLLAYANDGRLRWRYEPPAQCREQRFSIRCPYIHHAIVSPDGGAWLTEGDAEEADFLYSKVDRVVRVEPDGTVRKFPLPNAPRFEDDRLLLLGSDREVRMLWTADGWGSVGHLSIDRNGTSKYYEIALLGFGLPTLAGAVQNEAGEITLGFLIYGWALCAPIQPCDDPLLIARADAHGRVLWSMSSPWAVTSLLAFGEDGSTWLGTAHQPAQLVRVDPQGMSSTAFSSPLPERGDQTVLIDPTTDSVVHLGMTGARRVGSAGESLARVTWNDVATSGGVSSTRGYLLNRYEDGLTLRSRVDLLSVAEFLLEPVPGQRWSTRQLVSQEDGSHFVASTAQMWDGSTVARLARFDEPQSPAGLQVFANGLEP